MQQYFIEHVIDGDSICFNEEQSHHIKHVLRMKEGKQIQLVDSLGQVFSAYVSYEDDGVYANINELIEAFVSPIHVELQACLIKGDRWDFLLQKASEIGVDTIRPVSSRYCVVKLKESDVAKKLARWQNITQVACEQSKRHDLVDVLDLCNLSDLDSNADLKLVAYEAINEIELSLTDVLKQNTNIKTVAICIGPEGGFHIDEVNQLKDKGYQIVQLGPRILRAETAGVVSVDRIKNYFEGDCYE